ncbi:MAG: hypothetical protein KDJ52_19400 [Anaerolineae bacterium]|nr:hypothetical protein [Anaerolineae bacterium]
MRRRITILLLFAASAALLLTSTFQTFIREAIVIPLLYILWISRIILAAVPQTALWSCYMGLLLLIMGASLLPRRQKKRSQPPPARDSSSRLQNLTKLIEQAEHDDYFKWRLAQYLQNVSIDALAYHTGQANDVIRQQFKQNSANVPPELQRYFAAGLQPLGSMPSAQNRFVKRASTSPLDLDPAEVVKFLERLDETQPTI